MDGVDFEKELREASRALKRCTSYDELKTVWTKYHVTIGHRALGRLIVGQSIEDLVERRRAKGE